MLFEKRDLSSMQSNIGKPLSAEVIAGLKISTKLGFIKENQVADIYSDIDKLMAKMHALQNKLNRERDDKHGK